MTMRGSKRLALLQLPCAGVAAHSLRTLRARFPVQYPGVFFDKGHRFSQFMLCFNSLMVRLKEEQNSQLVLKLS